MREDAAIVGDGFYVYDFKDDVGVFRMIYNPDRKQFDVSGELTTSNTDGVKDFKRSGS